MRTGQSPIRIRGLDENRFPIGENKEARSLMEMQGKVFVVDDYSVFDILSCDCMLLHEVVALCGTEFIGRLKCSIE